MAKAKKKKNKKAAEIKISKAEKKKLAEVLKDPTIILDGGSVVSPELYKRASKKIGLTDVQISSYSDVEALKRALNYMHPQSNADARIKEGSPPKIHNFDDNMPDSFTLESVIEAKFVKTNRDHYDRGTLQAFLCRVNRKYGPHEPVRIVQDRSFKVVKRELVTKFTIYYK